MKQTDYTTDKGFGTWYRSQMVRDLFPFDLIQEMINSKDEPEKLKSYNDFVSFLKLYKMKKHCFQSLEEAFQIYCKIKNGKLNFKISDFEKIYKKMRKGHVSLMSSFNELNDRLNISETLDIRIFESFQRIADELDMLNTDLVDLAHSKGFDSADILSLENKYPMQENTIRIEEAHILGAKKAVKERF